MSDAHARAVEALRAWRADAKRFAWDLFAFTPDRWQARALDHWSDPTKQRIALQACAGPGKTALLAICGWHALLCQSDGRAFPNGAAMSSSGANLKANLWKELRVWRDRSPLLTRQFEMTTERIFEPAHPMTWFLDARSYAATSDEQAQGRTLSGLHAEHIFYLIDEGGDTAPSVLRAAEQGLSTCTWGKILVAGNPTSHTGLLYDAVVRQSDRWSVIRITGDPDDVERSPRVALDWAREQIAQHGRANPWVMAYILGEFPPVAFNALFSPDVVRAAMARHLREDQYDFAQKRIGVDVARFGDDATVLFPRQGAWAAMPVELRGVRSEVIAGRVMAAKAKWGSEMELVDSTGGYSVGVEDLCNAAGAPLYPVNFSSSADDPRYFNKRSEMYFRLSEWVATGALPPVDVLVSELCAHTYFFDKGRLRVAEKEQIKSNLGGHSPDHADALALTFAVADMPSARTNTAYIGAGARGLESEWDPVHGSRT